MAATARLGIIYPDENQDPYWNSFVSMIETVDSHLFANMADRNLFLRGGGTIALDTSSNELSWSDDIVLMDSVSGLVVTISASTLTLEDGNIAYIDISRVLSRSVATTLQTTMALGTGEGKIALWVRFGDRVFFRNGAVLSAGAGSSILESGASGDAKRGTASFSSGSSVSVTFTEAYPDTSYKVVGLTPYFAKGVYVSSKTASGFDISTIDGSSQTGDVDWKTERA